MQRLLLKPAGFPLPLGTCPPGLFWALRERKIGFKAHDISKLLIFEADWGLQHIWDGYKSWDEMASMTVIPLEMIWEEEIVND